MPPGLVHCPLLDNSTPNTSNNAVINLKFQNAELKNLVDLMTQDSYFDDFHKIPLKCQSPSKSSQVQSPIPVSSQILGKYFTWSPPATGDLNFEPTLSPTPARSLEMSIIPRPYLLKLHLILPN